MNNKGIFENLPSKPSSSPFSVVQDPAPESAPSSPFSAAPASPSPFAPASGSPFAPAGKSPFAVASESAAPKPGKLPDRRKSDSPFQISDSQEGFGFEASPSPFAAAPFEAAPSSPFSAAPSAEISSSPFAAAPAEPVARAASPFASEPAPAPFSQESAPAPAATWTPQPAPAPAPPAFAPVSAPAPAPVPAPSFAAESPSESSTIRQLELRAIFGVDREMSPDEIMQRSRALPGIRHIARVNASDIAAVDALKHVVANLGFGAGGLRLYAGSVPIDFIRESGVMLAIQTDGGFAPGVRETLMIVARELSRS